MGIFAEAWRAAISGDGDAECGTLEDFVDISLVDFLVFSYGLTAEGSEPGELGVYVAVFVEVVRTTKAIGVEEVAAGEGG